MINIIVRKNIQIFETTPKARKDKDYTMAHSENLAKKNWYIVSYFGIKSSLVAGQRCEQLKNFLLYKKTNTTLITARGSYTSPNDITITDPLESSGFFTHFWSGISLIDATFLWSFRVIKFLKRKESGVLFTSCPPFGVCLIGLLLKRRDSNHYWIIDFRDPWTTSHIYKPVFYAYKFFFASLFEKKIFQNADLIILNTDTDRNNYNIKYSFAEKKTITIRNGYDRQINNSGKDKTEDGVFKLVYAGGTYYKSSAALGIANFMDKINQKRKRFSCDIYGGYHSIFDKSKYINYKGMVTQDEVLNIISTYKAGLIFQPKECMKGGRINQKFYDYIACGLQPIVINPSIEIEKHLIKLRIGLTVKPEDRVVSLTKKVEKLFTSKSFPNDNLITEYARTFQFGKLYQYLLNKQIIE